MRYTNFCLLHFAFCLALKIECPISNLGVSRHLAPDTWHLILFLKASPTLGATDPGR